MERPGQLRPDLQAWSGFTQLTGFPDADPSGPASAYSDAVGGMAGAQAVLLALITGPGPDADSGSTFPVRVPVSLLETLVLDMSANGPSAATTRAGNRLPHSGGAPHGAYRCLGEDRWVAISVFSDEEWSAFAAAIGSPQWAADQRFATIDDRCSNADALDSSVESWTVRNTAEDVMHILQAAGVAAGVVQTGADLSRDPQLKERGFFRRVLDHQGRVQDHRKRPLQALHHSGQRHQGRPEFGADLTYVLREVLGMSDDELADCAIAGVFD